MSSATALRRVRRAGADSLRRGAFEVKTMVARYPSLALPMARRRHGEPLSSHTQIAIEGFPRTGTSFAVAAFRLAQPEPIVVASHVHAPAQLIGATRTGCPALAIVREPEPTMLSFVIRNPHLSAAQALRGYLRFYEPLLRHLDGIVVGTFDQVIGDLGRVIRRVNERFGTSFAEFRHTEENLARCFAEIDEDYGRRLEPGEAFERQVARPSEWRDMEKERIRGSYRTDRTRTLRARADRVYRVLADAADG